MNFDVAIIGAGLAGLSAGVHLSKRGARVLVLEQRPFAGGRTRSFTDATTGDIVDNGQHLMLGCYRETREYLDLIGSTSLTTLQQSLRVEFLRAGGSSAVLSCPPLPAPLHAGAGLLGLSSLGLIDRACLFRVGGKLLTSSRRKEDRLDSITVDRWLSGLGQSEGARRKLWNILAVGALNARPEETSALTFFRVLRATFLHSRQNASILLPRAGLSTVFVDPAVAFIERHGGHVVVSRNVVSATTSGGRVTFLRTDARTRHEADTYISAVPWHAFSRVFPENLIRTAVPPPPEGLAELFRPSAILNVHLWLSREIMEQEFVALIDSPVHWVFNLSRLLAPGARTHGGQRLSLTISSAEDQAGEDGNEIVRRCVAELRRFFPRFGEVSVTHSLVIKEKRATFIASPGLERYRPATRTNLTNLFFAGDWTDTGYPATIEGAVLSGRKAADAVQPTR